MCHQYFTTSSWHDAALLVDSCLRETSDLTHACIERRDVFFSMVAIPDQAFYKKMVKRPTDAGTIK